jgi:hypothetical protein
LQGAIFKTDVNALYGETSSSAGASGLNITYLSQYAVKTSLENVESSAALKRQ